MTDKQQAIFDLIVELEERFEQWRTELKELNRWIQEEAPRIAVEESRKVLERAEKAETFNAKWEQDYSSLLANRDAAIKRAEKAKAEVKRLRQELDYIANAKRKSFEDDTEFRLWAQNRARHALAPKASSTNSITYEEKEKTHVSL